MDEQPTATPFMRLAYLRRLHASASAVDADRLAAAVPAARADGALVAACPLYLKDALVRRVRVRLGLGGRLPAARPRLLPQAARRRSVHAGAGAAPARPQRSAPARCCCAACSNWRATPKLSSAHLLFLDEADQAAARDSRLDRCAARCSSTGEPRSRALRRLRRIPGQPAAREAKEDPAGTSPRRRRRRRRSPARGAAIGAADWDFFYRCYTLTYRAHHSSPYLTRDFFARVATTMPENWLLFIGLARRRAHRLLDDRGRSGAQGRVRPLLGRDRARQLPALRRLLLPAAGLVHRATATDASRAAPRASTRWRAACCRCRPGRRTGSRIRSSRAAIDDFLEREGAGVRATSTSSTSGGRSRPTAPA